MTLIEGESSSRVVSTNPHTEIFSGSRAGWLLRPITALVRALSLLNPSLVLELLSRAIDHVASVVHPRGDKRRKLLNWFRDTLPEARTRDLQSLHSIWQDGSLLCSLVHTVVPGCSPSRSTGAHSSFQQGQLLVCRYLGVPPAFTEEDIRHQALTSSLERRLVRYLSAVRQAAVPLLVANAPIRQKARPSTPLAVARGMGLLMAIQSRRAVFYLYPLDREEADHFLVQIQGPCCDFGSAVIPARATVGRGRQQRRASFILKPWFSTTRNVNIPIEWKVNPGSICVSYLPQSPGKHELCVTRRGCHLPGSPYIVIVDRNSCQYSRDDERWLSEEEVHKRPEFKKRLKVVLRIVDFVTEKMVLTDDGKLTKLNPMGMRTLSMPNLFSRLHATQPEKLQTHDDIKLRDKSMAQGQTWGEEGQLMSDAPSVESRVEQSSSQVDTNQNKSHDHPKFSNLEKKKQEKDHFGRKIKNVVSLCNYLVRNTPRQRSLEILNAAGCILDGRPIKLCKEMDILLMAALGRKSPVISEKTQLSSGESSLGVADTGTMKMKKSNRKVSFLIPERCRSPGEPSLSCGHKKENLPSYLRDTGQIPDAQTCVKCVRRELSGLNIISQLNNQTPSTDFSTKGYYSRLPDDSAHESRIGTTESESKVNNNMTTHQSQYLEEMNNGVAKLQSLSDGKFQFDVNNEVTTDRPLTTHKGNNGVTEKQPKHNEEFKLATQQTPNSEETNLGVNRDEAIRQTESNEESNFEINRHIATQQTQNKEEYNLEVNRDKATLQTQNNEESKLGVNIDMATLQTQNNEESKLGVNIDMATLQTQNNEESNLEVNRDKATQETQNNEANKEVRVPRERLGTKDEISMKSKEMRNSQGMKLVDIASFTNHLEDSDETHIATTTDKKDTENIPDESKHNRKFESDDAITLSELQEGTVSEKVEPHHTDTSSGEHTSSSLSPTSRHNESVTIQSNIKYSAQHSQIPKSQSESDVSTFHYTSKYTEGNLEFFHSKNTGSIQKTSQQNFTCSTLKSKGKENIPKSAEGLAECSKREQFSSEEKTNFVDLEDFIRDSPEPLGNFNLWSSDVAFGSPSDEYHSVVNFESILSAPNLEEALKIFEEDIQRAHEESRSNTNTEEASPVNIQQEGERDRSDSDYISMEDPRSSQEHSPENQQNRQESMLVDVNEWMRDRGQLGPAEREIWGMMEDCEPNRFYPRVLSPGIPDLECIAEEVEENTSEAITNQDRRSQNSDINNVTAELSDDETQGEEEQSEPNEIMLDNTVPVEDLLGRCFTNEQTNITGNNKLSGNHKGESGIGDLLDLAIDLGISIIERFPEEKTEETSQIQEHLSLDNSAIQDVHPTHHYDPESGKELLHGISHSDNLKPRPNVPIIIVEDMDMTTSDDESSNPDLIEEEFNTLAGLTEESWGEQTRSDESDTIYGAPVKTRVTHWKQYWDGKMAEQKRKEDGRATGLQKTIKKFTSQYLKSCSTSSWQPRKRRSPTIRIPGIVNKWRKTFEDPIGIEHDDPSLKRTNRVAKQWNKFFSNEPSTDLQQETAIAIGEPSNSIGMTTDYKDEEIETRLVDYPATPGFTLRVFSPVPAITKSHVAERRTSFEKVADKETEAATSNHVAKCKQNHTPTSNHVAKCKQFWDSLSKGDSEDTSRASKPSSNSIPNPEEKGNGGEDVWYRAKRVRLNTDGELSSGVSTPARRLEEDTGSLPEEPSTQQRVIPDIGKAPKETRSRFESAKLFFQILEKTTTTISRVPTTPSRLGRNNYASSTDLDDTESECGEEAQRRQRRRRRPKVCSEPTSDTESISRLGGLRRRGACGLVGGSERLPRRKVSERFHVKDLFKDVAGDVRSGFKGIPHREAVLAALRSVDNSRPVSPYEEQEFTTSPGPQTYHTEYPHLPDTPPCLFKPRDTLQYGSFITRRDLINM